MATPKLVVLENIWDVEWEEDRSVRPLFEGWSRSMGIDVAYKPFGNSEQLHAWLEMFAATKGSPSVCYIAGHGVGKRLAGFAKNDINLGAQIQNAFPRRRGRIPKIGAVQKGVLVGACGSWSESELERVLAVTNMNLGWFAAYHGDTWWFESTMADLLLLTYLFEGSPKARAVGGVAEYSGGGTGPMSPMSAASAMIRDFPLAKAMGFNIAVR